MLKYTESLPAQIGVTTANSILAVVNIVGNCLVCLVVIRHQEMRYDGDTIAFVPVQKKIKVKAKLCRNAKHCFVILG